MNDTRWFIDCNDSKLLLNKLNRFFMEHQALSRDLSEAKHLGMCQITTSQKAKPRFRSLDSMLKSGNDIMRIAITPTKNQSPKERI